MTRIVWLLVAVAAGLCAGILLASAPTVHYAGTTATCPGIIVTSESGNGLASDLGPAYTRACQDKQREWSVLAGLAAFVCLGAGSVARFSRPDPGSPSATAPAGHRPA